MSKKDIIIYLSLFLNVILMFLVFHYSIKVNESDDEQKLIQNLTPQAITKIPAIDDDVAAEQIQYYYSDLMNNPIDQAYEQRITEPHIPEIEYRDLQVKYMEVWENEYNKVLQILYDKAIYKKDRENIDKFNEYISNTFTSNKTFFETCVIKDFETNPDSPEKNSYGNGTTDKLNEIQGKLYRNACMLMIPLLTDGEYQYPESVDF